MRTSLVNALTACASPPNQPATRRFLAGLSADELQFLAEYQGCCVLEARPPDESIHRFQRLRVRRSKLAAADQEQKMILLMEYLRHAGTPRQARAGHAA